MNRSGIFFLIFAIVIAVAVTWLNSTWLTYQNFVFDRQVRQIDYYLTDFTIVNTYPDGSMQYRIKGQHLVHQESSKASKIIKPVIQARDIKNSLITITANEALQDSKNGPIILTDKVDIEKKSVDETENFKLLTSDLAYNPISRELSTDAELTFTSPSGELTGLGFSTKLDEQELRIHKNVQAKFIPSK